ncbi:hypothetical protein [Epibacterium ulvae]|uniref:hypothetical protein n=1 Tax=Epibacterium ulvae TaxID=1156985 RepID=UPI00248F70E5|nr:hypothetical protein [Epibacterium ulvae]
MQINNTLTWISHLTNIDRPAGHPEGSTFKPNFTQTLKFGEDFPFFDYDQDYSFEQWKEVTDKQKENIIITTNPFLDEQTKEKLEQTWEDLRASLPPERERYEQFLKFQKQLPVRLSLISRLRQFDDIRPARTTPPPKPTSPPVTIAIYEGDRLVAYGSEGVSALSEFAIRDGVSDLFRDWDRFAIHEMKKQLQEGLKEIGENFHVLTQQDGLNMNAFEALEQFRSH